MPSLLILNHVADYATWRSVFADLEMVRRANGSQGGQILRVSADPHAVLVLLEWDDLERARLFVDSDDLQEAIQRAGVTEEPKFWFLDDIEMTPA
jgi:heme-degrading monooxygenase HmoA